jgi:uncharacterized heparinase superfamily protein
VTDFIERLRRVSKRPPRYIAARLGDEIRRRLERPWSRVYPHIVTERRLLRVSGAESIDGLWAALRAMPFFIATERRGDLTRAFQARYPEAVPQVLAAAAGVLRHEFDLLGSGLVRLGPSLPWHQDFKSGREWPIEFSPLMDYVELGRPSDVKVPWELSRCQHFTTLGQAYWLTGDERYAQEFVNEIDDWIARNPWSYGVNWACAMDVALRAVNWIWAFFFFADAAACASPAFRGAFLRSLYMHGDYIAAHLERSDINGNHYLCDGVGLLFLGSFFSRTPHGREWRQTGRAIIGAEIFNQTSEDGVDFEKSTSYHRLVLEAFLTSHLLLSVHGDNLPRPWIDRLERMIEFVEAYTKPDGSVPLIGDADDGRVQKLGTQAINDHRYLLAAGAVLFGREDFKRTAQTFSDEAFWLLGLQGAGAFDSLPDAGGAPASKAFHAGGYYVLRSQRAHVIVDCGEVGMHGRGGHGHSDITGIEVWLDGMNLVTDCGAYVYTASREWRHRFRSTAFHNVVQVDDEELNRPISPDQLWQLRDDARPANASWIWNTDVDYFRGGHTGYQRLAPPVNVTREVALVKLARAGPEVIVCDSVDGSGEHRITWRFHLDPSVAADLDGTDIRLRARGGEVWLQTPGAPGLEAPSIDKGWVSPSYGVRVRTKVIVATAHRLPISVSWRFGIDRLSRADLQRALERALSHGDRVIG